MAKPDITTPIVLTAATYARLRASVEEHGIGSGYFYKGEQTAWPVLPEPCCALGHVRHTLRPGTLAAIAGITDQPPTTRKQRGGRRAKGAPRVADNLDHLRAAFARENAAFDAIAREMREAGLTSDESDYRVITVLSLRLDVPRRELASRSLELTRTARVSWSDYASAPGHRPIVAGDRAMSAPVAQEA